MIAENIRRERRGRDLFRCVPLMRYRIAVSHPIFQKFYSEQMGVQPGFRKGRKLKEIMSGQVSLYGVYFNTVRL